MDLLAFFDPPGFRAGLEERREGKPVRFDRVFHHLVEECDRDDRVFVVALAEASDYGVPGEGVAVRHLGEDPVCVIEVAVEEIGGGGAEAEELRGGESVSHLARFDERGVDLGEVSHGSASVDLREEGRRVR